MKTSETVTNDVFLIACLLSLIIFPRIKKLINGRKSFKFSEGLRKKKQNPRRGGEGSRLTTVRTKAEQLTSGGRAKSENKKNH